MKKIKYLFCVVLAAFTLSACDLDTEPYNAVSGGVIASDINNLDYTLNGAWRYLWENSSWQGCRGFYMLYCIMDLMAGDMAEPGGYGSSYAYTYLSGSSGPISPTSAFASRAWINGYFTINNMNFILSAIDDVYIDESSEAQKDMKKRIKAQALAIRGYVYTELATFFGDGFHINADEPCIPIYTTPTNLSTEGNEFSTQRQVFSRAETDLTDAYKLFESMSTPYKRGATVLDRGKIDMNIIAGLLARIYQRTYNWEDAQKYAELAHDGYEWMAQADYLDGFNSVSNAEWLWGHAQTTDQEGSSYIFHFKDVRPGGFPYYRGYMMDPHFYDEQFKDDPTDVRCQLFEFDLTSNRAGYLMYKKFRFREDNRGDHVLMRKAEMVLIEAEAYAENDELGLARGKVKELRDARGATNPTDAVLDAMNKEQLIEQILIERRKELYGEGFGLTDIKRTGKSVVRRIYPDNVPVPGQTTVMIKGHRQVNISGTEPFTADHPYYSLPIPQTELNYNPNVPE